MLRRVKVVLLAAIISLSPGIGAKILRDAGPPPVWAEGVMLLATTSGTPVAWVNEEPIDREIFRSSLQTIEATMGPLDPETIQQVFNLIVQQILLNQEGQRRGLGIPREQARQEVQAYLERTRRDPTAWGALVRQAEARGLRPGDPDFLSQLTAQLEESFVRSAPGRKLVAEIRKEAGGDQCRFARAMRDLILQLGARADIRLESAALPPEWAGLHVPRPEDLPWARFPDPSCPPTSSLGSAGFVDMV